MHAHKRDAIVLTLILLVLFSIIPRATAQQPSRESWHGAAGMWYDETVGLYFTPSGRVYNPRLGRWMQRDPIHAGMPHVSWSRTNGPHITVMPMHTPPYVDGLSPYEYVRSNPVNRRDPSGMFSLADFASTTAIRLELAGSSFAVAHPLAMRFAGGLLAAANLYAFAQYEEVQAIVLSQPNAAGFLAGEAAALRLAVRDLTRTAGSITALTRASPETLELVAAARVSTQSMQATSGIRLAQKGVSLAFQDGGPFAGKTYFEVAEMLRAGQISPSALPIEFVVYNGVRYSVNTRSLMALRLAGMEPTITYDVTNVPGKLEKVLERIRQIGFEPGPGFVPELRGVP